MSNNPPVFRSGNVVPLNQGMVETPPPVTVGVRTGSDIPAGKEIGGGQGSIAAVVNIRGLGPTVIRAPDRQQLQNMMDNPQVINQYLDDRFDEFRGFVDTIYAGMPMSDKAALWTSPVPIVGDAAGLFADALNYIKNPESRTLANGLLTLMSAAPLVPNKRLLDQADQVKRNIQAWHGSPHKFDKFSMEHIGKGEGAQAYGHGLYFAENKGVADDYYENFSQPRLEVGGRPADLIYTREIRERFADLYEQALDTDAIDQYKLSVLDQLGDVSEDHYQAASDTLDRMFEWADTTEIHPGDIENLQTLGAQVDPDDIYRFYDDRDKLDIVLSKLSQADNMENAQFVINGFTGDERRVFDKYVGDTLQEVKPQAAMYQVGLNVSEDELLDWDAPFNKQPANVNAAIKSLLVGDDTVLNELFSDGIPAQYAGMFENSSGGQIYNTLAKDLGISEAELSKRLFEKGVPGIRYYDGMSRGSAGGELIDVYQEADGWHSKIKVAGRGGADLFTKSMPFPDEVGAREWAERKIKEGTRNYVIFDDSLIDINSVDNKQTLQGIINSARERGVKLDAFENDGRINLSRIVVPEDERGQGIGSEIMRQLTDYADANRETITLSPTTDFGATSNKRLEGFYKGFDFVKNQGRSKDYEIFESMYRAPK